MVLRAPVLASELVACLRDLLHHRHQTFVQKAECGGEVVFGGRDERETLGFGGRRVLVSRTWSGKSLADHKAARRHAVLTLLAGETGRT
jgi:hypothetical protein